jgi:hypothetical protein
MNTVSLDIERRQRTNDKGDTYSQYFLDGKMVGCGCAEAQAVTIEKYNFKPCKHLRDANATQAITGEDVVQHIEDDLRSRALSYEGCDFCGRNHKSWNCPF